MNRKERKWKNYGENMIKKVFCSFILIALICCSVCSCASDPVNAVQEEFAKFKTMNSVALVGENELITKNLRINLEETLVVAAVVAVAKASMNFADAAALADTQLLWGKRRSKSEYFLCKVEKEEKSLKKWKKSVDKWA